MASRPYRNSKPGCLIVILIVLALFISVTIVKAIDKKKAQEQENYHLAMQEALSDTANFQVTGDKAISYAGLKYSTSFVPESYIAETPKEVRYIIRGESGQEVVGRYSDMSSAIQHWWTLTVEDLATGEVMATREFWGNNPPSSKSSEGDVHMHPNRDYMLEWVQNVLDGTAMEATTPQPTEEIPEEPVTEPPTENQSEENEEALNAALAYLSYDFGESPQTLTDYLRQEGFSTQAAEYAVEHCNADWMEEAVKCSAFILENYDHVTTKEDMISMMEQWGFTHEQAVHAADLAEFE